MTQVTSGMSASGSAGLDGRRLKVLLSGPGLIGKRHGEIIAASDRSELAGVVAPRSDENIAFARGYDVPLYETVDAALAAVTFDATIIASPNAFHHEQAKACLRSGVPTLVEKPLTADLDTAFELVTLSRDLQIPVLVGHHRTYSEYLPAARAFIQSAEFGQLVAVQGSALFRKPEKYFEDGPWRTRPGGGPILINLIHDIGILQYLCGPISEVFCHTSNARRGFAVEDTVSISFRFQNGALGTFLVSDIAGSDKSWEMTSGENKAYPHFQQSDCYHFAGTNGSLDFPTMNVRSYDASVPPSWWRPFQHRRLVTASTDPLVRQLAHFEDVILLGAAPIVSAEMGYRNMLVVDAVIQSSLRGQPMTVKTL